MAKKSVFGHKVTGPLMRGMKHIPVDRHAGVASFEQALAAVRGGEIVGVFPEATMSRSFELKPFKTGAARIAQDGGVPLLPTTVWGSQRVWTKEAPKNLGRSNTAIHVTVGAPIHVAPDDDPAEVTEVLRERMSEQLLAQQGAYPQLTGTDLRYLPARLGGTAPTPEEAASRDHHDMTRTVDKFNRGAGLISAWASGAGVKRRSQVGEGLPEQHVMPAVGSANSSGSRASSGVIQARSRASCCGRGAGRGPRRARA
jgi:hypothetical protein